MTRERVRQIEVKAIRKLGLALALRGLTPDDVLLDRPEVGFAVKKLYRAP